MRLLLIIEIICFFGILALQVYLGARGIVSAPLFAVLLVAPLSLIMITGVLYYSSPGYPFGLAMGIIATIVFSAIGYPLACWLYRQVPPRK